MKLRYQTRALQQIDMALAYLSARSPQGAARVEDRLRAMATLIQLQSGAGKKTSVENVRRVYLTPYPYLIDYFIGEDEIVIQRFRHVARKILRD